MEPNRSSTEGLSNKVHSIVNDVKKALKAQRGVEYDDQAVEDSITQCVALKLENLEEEMREMFTSPARLEFNELALMLERRAAQNKELEIEEAVGLARQFGDKSVFAGNTVFSKAKMGAMIQYLTNKGHNVYKTSLNKLLFYSDLTSYYLLNHGISGAIYQNRQYGPVADPAEPILNELIDQKKIEVASRTKTLNSVSVDQSMVLSEAECKILDWVAETYGTMSASEISDFSHREMAYKNTQPNEPIAYAYAQFLKHLPPANLLAQ
jgi:uncharacterized phage-associated protein